MFLMEQSTLVLANERNPMLKQSILTVGFVALSAAAIAPAAAGTQDDIRECKAQITAQNVVNADEYRLKFDTVKGASKKRLTFDAMPVGGGDELKVKCVVKRGKVLEVTLAS